MSWLERVWMEVTDEINYESLHPQGLHGTDACPGCVIERKPEHPIADCGCVHHAEDGILCVHDKELLSKD
jgi:hypothetical protein